MTVKPSRYVRRCTQCGNVRGLTSFPVKKKTGERLSICRWCEETFDNKARDRARRARAHQQFQRRAVQLERELERVRVKIATYERTQGAA